MAFATSTIALVSLGVAAAGTYMQYEGAKESAAAGRRQADAMREQAALEQRKADIQNLRQVRAAVRQARMARAAVINTGANVGTLGSSGVMGGASSVTSNNSSNMSFFGQMSDLNSGIYSTQVEQAGALQDKGDAAVTSAMGGALGRLGGTIFSDMGGFKTVFQS